MNHTLHKVIGGLGGYVSKRQSLAMLRSPGQSSQPEKDRSQGLIVHRPVKVKLPQGVGPLPQCTAAGSGQLHQLSQRERETEHTL
jgi:hypothetical protein